MKKRFASVALIFILTFSACVPQNNDELSPPPTPASVEPSAGIESAAPIVEQSTIPQIIEPTPEALSYEEYFSEYREFTRQYDEDVFKYESIFINDGWIYSYREDLVRNALYWEHEIKSDNGYAYETQLIAKDISWFEIVDDRFFIVQENAIYSLDANGGDQKFVLEAPDNITHMIANDTLVFYIAGERLYRFYQPDGTTDFLGETPQVYDFYPQSNCEVLWHVQNPDYPHDPALTEITDIPAMIDYYVNSETGENRLITFEEKINKFGGH